MRITGAICKGFLVFITLLGMPFPARILGAGTITGWGSSSTTQFNFPAGLTNVTAISAGELHVLALLSNQTVVAWGDANNGQLNIPASLTNIVAIAAGSYHNLALTKKGTVVQWGQGTPRKLKLRNIIAIAAGNDFSLALHRNGTIAAWGTNSPGIPRRLKHVVAIAAGDSHALALKNDGTVIGWGANDFGQTNVPRGLSNVVMIAAGHQSSVAVTADGKIWQWGRIAALTPIPEPHPGGIAQIAVGAYHVVVRTTNGAIFGWGQDSANALSFPTNVTGISAIAVGPTTTFAAVPWPVFRGQPKNQSVLSGLSVAFNALVESATPFQYQWFFNNSPLPQGGTSATLLLTNVHTSAAGNYSLVISNEFGSSTSSAAALQVTALEVLSEIVFVNDISRRTAYFRAQIGSVLPASYQWYFNENEIVGATDTEMWLSDYHSADQGSYSVCVSNDDTNVCLTPVSLSVPPQWAVDDSSIIKTNGTTNLLTFRLWMADGARPDTQNVSYETFDGTAKAHVDYLPVNGSATFEPGMTNVFVTVPVIGSTNSGPRSFQVQTFATSTLRDSATMWILDADYVPSILPVNQFLAEGPGTAIVPENIQLSGAAAQPVSVNYITADGSARAGVDYMATNGQIVFPPGTTSQPLPITILGNLLKETNRNFYVNFSAPVNATLATNQIQDWILDDDSLVVPPGFDATIVATNLLYPSAMDFAPDGRLFICQQEGKLRIVKDDVLLAAPFVQIPVASGASEGSEDGLLGVTFDPGFNTNHYIYVYYTAYLPNLHNRISRFTANGDTAVAGSEYVVLDLDAIPSSSNHNGGAIHFGPDGKLYVAVGDNAHGANAQTKTNLLGKILRINSDGSIPTDNPFYSSATGVNRAIWALGLRNPFSFAFQPGTGRMLINDVGQDTWEEINQGAAGANYGWPFAEGPTNSIYQNPVFAYTHTNGCAIVGATFYNPIQAQFPADYVGNYFFTDYCGGWIQRMGADNVPKNFISGIGLQVALQVGPDGSLYCLSSSLLKITYNGTAQ